MASLFLEAKAGKDWKNFGMNQLFNEMELVNEGLEYRNQLMFEGQIPLPPLKLEDVFSKGKRSEPSGIFSVFQLELIESDISVWHNEKNELIVIGNDTEKFVRIFSGFSKAVDQLRAGDGW